MLGCDALHRHSSSLEIGVCREQDPENLTRFADFHVLVSRLHPQDPGSIESLREVVQGDGEIDAAVSNTVKCKES